MQNWSLETEGFLLISFYSAIEQYLFESQALCGMSEDAEISKAWAHDFKEMIVWTILLEEWWMMWGYRGQGTEISENFQL